jgi:hypothetical protein
VLYSAPKPVLQEFELKRAPALILAFLFAFPFTRCFAQERIEMEAARKLFEAKCSGCHHPDRALKKIKNREGWKKTVERMRTYTPGRISADEAQTIIEYLSRVRGPMP